MDEKDQQIEKLTQQLAQLQTELDAAKAAVKTPPDQEQAIQAAVTAAIADIKVKLDGAYKARDDALGKVAEAERLKNEEIKAKLIAEGKHKELADMQIAEKDARIKDLEKANTELARNNEVRQLLGTLEFRNDKASDLAFKEITSELIRNEQGFWVHKSGKSIKDYVGEFVKDESQSFLFKPKTNNGGGQQPPNNGGGGNGETSLFKLSQAEVLKRAAAGTLRKK